jgi:ketosteroid isomerase-like protein
MYEASVDLPAEIQRIRDSDRALLRAETERDLEGAMEHIAAGAVLQPPNAPPVVGTTAIRAFYREWFETPYRAIVWESDTVMTSSAGDLAYLVGKSRVELETPDGVNQFPGKYITIWRKTDGRWLCVAVSWSGNQPAENLGSAG